MNPLTQRLSTLATRAREHLRPQRAENRNRDTDPEIACNMAVFDANERSRHTDTAEAVFTGVDSVSRTDSGYVFRLDTGPETLSRAAEFMARERQCCPFFRFDLRIPAGEDSAWLELSGPPAVRAYMEAELIPHIRSPGAGQC